MATTKRLYLYEEILLLALLDEKGTTGACSPEMAIAGAVLAELLMDRRIALSADRKQLVELLDATPYGDPVIDLCLERIRTAKRRASAQSWVSKLCGIKDLTHTAARQLVARKIVRADEDTVLLLFKRRIYPQINPVPERAILKRLAEAILTDTPKVDPRTIVLLALAKGGNLLRRGFKSGDLWRRRKRIQAVIKGEGIAVTARDAVEAAQAAMVMVAVMPAITAAMVATM
jgi:golgi phosphoprotein 3